MIADDLSRIAMSLSLGDTVARAVEYARAQSHLEVTLEHMLMALCEDPDADLVLAASNIDVTRLRTEVSGYLGALDRRTAPGQSVNPVISPDLRRILEAAAAAARGGRRREINGAIVLAAIVGDGKSPAAHLLRAQGLTFEGAIRALQRGQSVGAGRQPGAAAPAALPTADDLLANARERVQSRTLPGVRRPEVDWAPPREEPAEPAQAYEEPAYQEFAPPEAPEEEAAPAAAAPGSDGSDWSIADEGEAVEAPADEEPPEMPASAPPPPPLPASEASSSWTPPPSRDQAMLARPAPPPLPGGPPLQPAPPPLAPWPSHGAEKAPAMPRQERSRPMGVGAASDGPSLLERVGALDRRYDRPLPGAPGAGPRPGVPQPSRGAVGHPRAEIGQLVENIPRAMRVAVPVLIEVRIARADVQNLAEGLQGGGAAYQHEVTVTKAMSVRLRAPDGGFFIESASPETQWIEKTLLLSADDFASWRWHVTPREKGRRRLQLIISARTVGADGIAAETALPDQVITVRVRTNYAKTAKHWAGWIAAALAGGVIAKFGEGAFDPLAQMLARLFNQ